MGTTTTLLPPRPLTRIWTPPQIAAPNRFVVGVVDDLSMIFDDFLKNELASFRVPHRRARAAPAAAAAGRWAPS